MTDEVGTDAGKPPTAGAPSEPPESVVIAVLYADDRSEIIVADGALARVGITAEQALASLQFHIANCRRQAVREVADRQARSAVAPDPVSKE